MKKRPIVLFDIDGTVANAEHRLHYILRPKEENGVPSKEFKKDWTKFHQKAHLDTPIENTISVLHHLQMFCEIRFITGRNETCRKETIAWLEKHLQLVSLNLTMRSKNDFRPDYCVKEDIYMAMSEEDKDRIVCVFEDRDQVVKMWRAHGLTCYQVCDGDY